MRKIIYYENILEYKKTSGSGLSWNEFKNWHELCRCCLEVGATTFENACILQLDGDFITIEEMIVSCTGRKFDANERLPKCICKECLNKLSMLYQFKIQCERAQNVLNELLSKLEESGNEPEEPIEGNRVEIKSVADKEVSDKTDCVVVVDDDDSSRYDEEAVDSLHEYSMESAQVEAEMEENMRDLVEEETNDATALQYEAEEENVDMSEGTEVIISQEDAEEGSGIIASEDVEAKEVVPAEDYEEEYPNEKAEEEQEENEVLESIYEVEENAKIDLEESIDIKEIQMEEEYLTEEVYMTTRNDNVAKEKVVTVYHLNYAKEKESAQNEELSECEGRKPKKKKKKENDKISTPLLENLNCLVCNETFELQRELIDHVHLKHPNRKAFKCRECSAMFTHIQSLSRHCKSHKFRNYVCSFCAKCFFRADDLTRHLRIHTGERPYPCELCPKAFKQPSELREHQLAHTKEKRFQCEFCSLCLTSRNGIFVHRKRHHSYELEVRSKMKKEKC